mgnify:CR=1 FL=1
MDDAWMASLYLPENVLFVCKLNPITEDEDLEIIFSRFGPIRKCEIKRDQKSGDSLCYAFVEFEDVKACEEAYFKMQGALVDAQASLRKELTTAVDSASSATTSAVEGAKRLAKSAQDAADGANHKVRDLETRLASTERSLKTLELLKRSG